MSILIKGMKMPENCGECRFHVDGWCYALLPESQEERKRITTNYCPLIEAEEPKHGKWKSVMYNTGTLRFPYPVCSVCNKASSVLYKPPFCPNCGADMRGDRDD